MPSIASDPAAPEAGGKIFRDADHVHTEPYYTIPASARPTGRRICHDAVRFVLIASEFMPVSLLTPIARDLNVTEGWQARHCDFRRPCGVTSLIIPTLPGV